MPRPTDTRPFQDDFIAQFVARWNGLMVKQLADATIRLEHEIKREKYEDRLVVYCSVGTEPAIIKRHFAIEAKPIRDPADIQDVVVRLERFMVDIRSWAATAKLRAVKAARRAVNARRLAEQIAANAAKPALPKRPRGRPRKYGDEYDNTPFGRILAQRRAYDLKRKAAKTARKIG